MGLTSLARINRSGVYDFWENFWETRYLYKHFLFNTHTIQNIYYEILSLFFFKYILSKSVISSSPLSEGLIFLAIFTTSLS